MGDVFGDVVGDGVGVFDIFLFDDFDFLVFDCVFVGGFEVDILVVYWWDVFGGWFYNLWKFLVIFVLFESMFG